MGWRSAASDRTFTCSQARVLRQLAAAWCPDRASALIVDLQCSCIILPNDRFSTMRAEALSGHQAAASCRRTRAWLQVNVLSLAALRHPILLPPQTPVQSAG